MSILIDKNTKVLVQGITGGTGKFHTEQMIAYGTNVVGGVTPGKGGQWAAGVPVYDTMREAVAATGRKFDPASVAASQSYCSRPSVRVQFWSVLPSLSLPRARAVVGQKGSSTTKRASPHSNA